MKNHFLDSERSYEYTDFTVMSVCFMHEYTINGNEMHRSLTLRMVSKRKSDLVGTFKREKLKKFTVYPK